MVLLLLCFFFSIGSCVTLKKSKGGLEDNQAPVLKSSIPENENTYFQGQSVTFVFDKSIRVENLLNNVKISPSIEVDKKDKGFDYDVSGRTLTLRFKQPLDDHTTYIIDIKGCIKGLSDQSKPAKKIRLSFSTGELDKGHIKGKVKFPLTNEPGKKLQVLFYDLNKKTQTPLKNKKNRSTENTSLEKNKNPKLLKKKELPSILTDDVPRYKLNTNEDGSFEIKHMKKGTYLAYVTNEVSAEKEGKDIVVAGFLKKPIVLGDQPINDLEVNVFNLSPIELKIDETVKANTSFDIKFNKAIAQYSLNFKEIPKYFKNPPFIYSKLLNSKQLRIYNTFFALPEDIPLLLNIKAKDKQGNNINDTDQPVEVKLKFLSEKSEKDPFYFQIIPASGLIDENACIKVRFTKPIKKITSSKIFFQFEDDDKRVYLKPSDLKLDKYKNTLTIKKHITDKWIKSEGRPIPRKKPSLKQQDLSKDINKNKLKEAEKLPDEIPSNDTKTFSLVLGKGCFKSIEEDESMPNKSHYSLKDPAKTGIIKGHFATEHPHFVLQLLNRENFKVVASVKSNKNFIFKDLLPGEYLLRALITYGKDAKWRYMNIRKRIEADPVAFYNRPLSIKEGLTLNVAGFTWKKKEKNIKQVHQETQEIKKPKPTTLKSSKK